MIGKKRKKHRLLRLICTLAALAAVCFLALLGFVLIQESGVVKDVEKLDGSYDAIIVLGAQVLPSGEPNVQLQLRLDGAIEAWRKHPVPVVVCGAQGSNEPMPEADAMKKYMADRGVDAEMIYTDPESYNTEQNLANAGKILRELSGVRKVLIVSSDYHVPRALALARDQGFDAVGFGTPIKPEYWIKNHVRESLAWVKYALKKTLNISL